MLSVCLVVAIFIITLLMKSSLPELPSWLYKEDIGLEPCSQNAAGNRVSPDSLAHPSLLCHTVPSTQPPRKGPPLVPEDHHLIRSLVTSEAVESPRLLDSDSEDQPP